MLRLDDFYREIIDPDMPHTGDGAIDWDDLLSWDLAAAVVAIESLCGTGNAVVPSYDIASSMRIGSSTLTAADLFVAEGLLHPRSPRHAGNAACLRRPFAYVTTDLRHSC